MAMESLVKNRLVRKNSMFFDFKYMKRIFVALILFIPALWLSVVIALTMLWYGATVWLNKLRPVKKVIKRADQFVKHLGFLWLKDERNSPYLYSFIGLGIGAPVLFFASAIYQLNVQAFDWGAAMAYHVILYGPYFAFFSQIATMIHKEGHEHRGLFKTGSKLVNKYYGDFLGILYGHVPEGYPIGHVRIHHRHDNAPDDVSSTIEFDRTKPISFLDYMFKFILFWTGVSVAYYHYKNRRRQNFLKIAYGMFSYYGLISVAMFLNFEFGLVYLLLPLLSSIILLGVINYTWHAWHDADDVENIYKNSVTILNGQYNVFNEDYHVEHHLRTSSHWAEYPVNFERHRNEYLENHAIIFTNTQVFVVFFWILFGAYEKMVEHFVDLKGDMSEAEKMALLKRRLGRVESVNSA